MAAKDPLKKMPSTTAKATSRVAKLAFEVIHLAAHAALRETHGMVSMARNRWSFAAVPSTSESIIRLYASECTLSMAIWKA